jgi:methionine aminopeptidase
MRAAGALAARILAHAGSLCTVGTTTEAIDAAVHRMAVENGSYPSPLRYGSPPFPKSVCTSVNECICHGIPDGRALQDGDIVNVDVTIWLDGYHGDTSRCALHWRPDLIYCAQLHTRQSRVYSARLDWCSQCFADNMAGRVKQG